MSTTDKLEKASAALGLITTLGSAIVGAIENARDRGYTEKQIKLALTDPGGVGQDILDSVALRALNLSSMRNAKK